MYKIITHIKTWIRVPESHGACVRTESTQRAYCVSVDETERPAEVVAVLLLTHSTPSLQLYIPLCCDLF